ncbi:MAG TPA: hypothetical protein VF103_03565 [Polyangiaceae bacterium]
MKRSKRLPRLVRVFGCLLRAAALVFVLQLGGVIHAAADALATAGFLAADHEQCPADGACDDCLAGCPNCHCSAALRTVAPDPSLIVEPAHGEPKASPCSVESSSAPLGPILPSLYRPPRSFVRAVTS